MYTFLFCKIFICKCNFVLINKLEKKKKKNLISNKSEWSNCFIKNRRQILLDFADFAWLEQPEGNLMESISRVWYNGSYTIAAKPIKTLELHYTMIQFLIITG